MPRRLLVLLVLAVAGLVVAPSAPAWACVCGVPRYDGDLVVVGVAEEVRKPGTGAELRVRIRVESVERGRAGESVELVTALHGTSCGYLFREGRRYRIFMNEGSTSSCAGNEELSFMDHPGDGPPWALMWSLASGAVLVAALLLFRRGANASDQ